MIPRIKCSRIGGVLMGAALTMCFGGIAGAQTSRITGTVTRDSLDNRLAGAEVSIPSVNRSTKTNYLGEFRLDRLAAGTYTVTIKQVGFESLTDTITVGENGAIDRWFEMRPSSVALAPVVTTDSQPQHISAALREFE